MTSNRDTEKAMSEKAMSEKAMSEMRHTLVSARGNDLIVLFVPEITDEQMDTVEHFMDAISETTDATLAILPTEVITDCRNYTLKELIGLRDLIDELLDDRIKEFPVIEA